MFEASMHVMYTHTHVCISLTMLGGGLGGSGGADDSLMVLLRNLREPGGGNVEAVKNILHITCFVRVVSHSM